MAKRRFAVLFTVLGVAVFISMAGFALLYLAFGRAPSVPSNATLVLRVGGDLSEMAPGRRRRISPRRQDADRALGRRQPAQGESGFADPRRAGQADRLHVAVLGQGAGGPRRDARFQEIGQAALRVPRIRRRSRVLPRDGGRQGLPDAVDVARSGRRRHVRAVPAGHARQDWRVSGSASHRRLQDGGEHVHREGLHGGAQGDGRGAQSRSVQSDRRRHRRGAEEGRSGNPAAHRSGAVPSRGGAPRRARRRRAVRRSGEHEAAGRGREPRQIDGDDYARVSDRRSG